MHTSHLVTTRTELRAGGATDRQIFTALRRSRLIAVRRGMLATPQVDQLDAQAAAAVRAVRREVVVSHAHAARLWGLPAPVGGWPPLTLTATSGPTRRRHGLHVVVAPCDDDQIVLGRDGIPITSLPRTVADCLRTFRPHDGLAMVDHAMRCLGLTVQDLGIALHAERGWPGVVQARTVAALADARRESPLESWSAWTFQLAGLPAAQPQVQLLTQAGRFVARVDSWWRGVAGESDGRAKYLLAAAERGGADAEALTEVLAAERVREQDIRRLGAEVVRWGAGDVLQPQRRDALCLHLNDTITRARVRCRFTGLAVISPRR